MLVDTNDSQLDRNRLLLFDAFIVEENFSSLLSLSSKLLGNPLIVIDLSYRIVGYSNLEEITDTFWVDNIHRGYCDFDFIIQVNTLPSVKLGKKTEEVYEVRCDQSNNNKLVCKMELNGTLVGNIILLGCKKEISQDDFKLIATVSKLLALKMKRNLIVQKDKNIICQEFLSDVLNHNFSSRDEMNARMKMANIKLQKNICIVALDITRYNDRQKSCDQVKNIILSNQILMEYSVFYEHRIVMIYQQDKVDEIKKKIIPILEKYSIYAGVSRTFSDLFLCKKYYLQAIKTIELGKYAFPDKHFLNYYEVQYYSLLPYTSNDWDDNDFCHPNLQKLKSYDNLHNTDLYDILYVYILYDGSIQKTAQEFFVHRNTVRYKINKIKELTSIDFTDILDISNILISYRIEKYLKSARKET